MATTRQPPAAPTSAFRTVALGVSGLVGVAFVLTSAVVIRYGADTREFGWSPGRGDPPAVVRDVAPAGAAAGLLQPGDVIVALDGDRRVARLGSRSFSQLLRPGPRYTLTVRRDDVERRVTLTVGRGTSVEQARLSYSLLFDALTWFVVATLIALFRPEQVVSRSAYLAGMALGLFMLAQARGPAMAWVSPATRTALLFI